MDLSIPFLLLYQGVMSLLNWSLVLVQRAHLAGTFMGTFCVSLALVDSLFAATTIAIYGLQDFMLLGVRLTRHHVCLLAQVMGCVYSTLHWPVLFAAALDHLTSPPPPPLQLPPSALLPAPLGPTVGQERGTGNGKGKGRAGDWRLGHVACAGMLWASSVVYVFLGPGALQPALDDSPHLLLGSCKAHNGTAHSLIAIGLLVTVACVTLYGKLMQGGHADSAYSVEEKDSKRSARPLRQRFRHRGEHSRIGIVGHALTVFTKTWAAFLILVVAVLVFRTDVPSHLAMNVLWLCFLNSFLISVCLCAHYRHLKANKISKLTDGFCQWELTFAEGGAT